MAVALAAQTDFPRQWRSLPLCTHCHTVTRNHSLIPTSNSLKLKESKAKGGGLVVDGVSGNAAKSGIKPGDTIIYASSFFGDELWPADKLSFTQTAINRAPSPVAFVYVSSNPGPRCLRVGCGDLGGNRVSGK